MTAPRRVGIVLKGYPRLSETFIAQEIRELERRGLDITLYSLRHPTDTARHPIHDEIQAPVVYLPEYLRDDVPRVKAAIRKCRTLPGYEKTLEQWERDFVRDSSTNRVRRLGQAFVLAAEMPADMDFLYAHFLHTPASVAYYAAMLTGRDWAVSAHAKDIWTSPDWEKREKLHHASWCVTCTAANTAHLSTLAPPGRVQLVYHGLDLSRFPSPPLRAGENTVPTILSVGRAVPKKGYDVLLKALARIPDDVGWRFVHIGGGDLLPELTNQAAELGLSDRIEWRGSAPQTAVIEALRQADIFTLASKITEDGDRDGLPNVIVEAQSQRLPVVSTAISAIPELISDGENGLLVPAENATALAHALTRLLTDRSLAREMGALGEQKVRTAFEMQQCITTLAEKFSLGEN